MACKQIRLWQRLAITSCFRTIVDPGQNSSAVPLAFVVLAPERKFTKMLHPVAISLPASEKFLQATCPHK
jgi:hypothetical protein